MPRRGVLVRFCETFSNGRPELSVRFRWMQVSAYISWGVFGCFRSILQISKRLHFIEADKGNQEGLMKAVPQTPLAIGCGLFRMAWFVGYSIYAVCPRLESALVSDFHSPFCHYSVATTVVATWSPQQSSGPPDCTLSRPHTMLSGCCFRSSSGLLLVIRSQDSSAQTCSQPVVTMKTS